MDKKTYLLYKEATVLIVVKYLYFALPIIHTTFTVHISVLACHLTG